MIVRLRACAERVSCEREGELGRGEGRDAQTMGDDEERRVGKLLPDRLRDAAGGHHKRSAAAVSDRRREREAKEEDEEWEEEEEQGRTARPSRCPSTQSPRRVGGPCCA